ncbi:response regulator [Phyllobacterium myrsinacearum]|uniref:Two-component system response regulator n=1 Tax=Phyllobacterium myrsinacearum TaxID=28101 RepID=A0A2S9JP94_9HYPH|nr:response regulator transcription factor [Phyllobacterium myrsinacearum]PRD55015.1 two-component system response regulator [Phyllobacterium myrsinacearum]PWV90434.1 DNA-binding response OmpR family regulator [Phyllobacterium myrsinacearum]RZS79833.1 DNA-binding response OmpR family regulator [Phyllobacterium myrsinacearum]RZV05372.1 DNA-binding response OmpR family regulator [Phyllobacterium myrsinacearum]
MRVLIVEDDSELADWLKDTLANAIGPTDVFSTIGEAEAALSTHQFDLVVIDRCLPDGDGLTLLSALKASRSQPATLFLTALDDHRDIIAALDRGADEYIGKPFEPTELVARARAVLRRYNLDRNGTDQIGNLCFNLHHRSVVVNEEPLEVPRRELAILEALVRRAGRVVQREALEASVYSIDDEIESNVIDSHVSRLRRRLREAGCNALIRTIRGVGYVLTTP